MSSTLVLRGIVISGVGEGSHYVELYRSSLERLLGDRVYPGTLNIKLDRCFTELVKDIKPAIVKPPRGGLGEVYVFTGYIGDYRVLVLKPLITIHECDLVEVVSSVKLRDVLGLDNGDLVEVVLVEE